jgi:hypothetical protein
MHILLDAATKQVITDIEEVQKIISRYGTGKLQSSPVLKKALASVEALKAALKSV